MSLKSEHLTPSTFHTWTDGQKFVVAIDFMAREINITMFTSTSITLIPQWGFVESVMRFILALPKHSTVYLICPVTDARVIYDSLSTRDIRHLIC